MNNKRFGIWLTSAMRLLSIGTAGASVFTAVVYQHSDYQGDSQTFTDMIDILCVPKFSSTMNDQTSSVKLSSPKACITLWADPNCAGSSFNVIGQNRLTDSINDMASSMSGCSYTYGISNGNATVSPWPIPIPNPPPVTWQEHWFEHNQLLTRVFYNEILAVYFDSAVSRTVTWPFTYLNQAWNYVVSTYSDGRLGPDVRLYAIFHAGKYSGGHPAYYWSRDHDNRNVIDVGTGDPNAWTSGQGNDLDIVTHEIAHIVESTAGLVAGSPAFSLWGDSKWAEIFIYDVYVGLNRAANASRWLTVMDQGAGDSFPRANPPSKWFRDWFLPIYQTYGQTRVLQNFFVLLNRHFPSSNQAGTYRQYVGQMGNYGEFVHFWSGASGFNLRWKFESAFGWSAQWETQFRQAQTKYSGIRYSHLDQ